MSTIDNLGPESDRNLTKRRVLYGVTTVVVTAVVGLGVIDAVGWFNPYGVDSATRTASGGGYELAVLYPAVSRPALASPLQIDVTRLGGFDGPITIAITQDYLTLWDENGLVPAPAAETTRGPWVDWEFDPPAGDTLTVFYDARIEPAAQSGKSGAVAVVEGGQNVVEVEFDTQVRP